MATVNTKPRSIRLLFNLSETSMYRFLVLWLTTAIALGAASWILPGVNINSLATLLISALVLGFVNAVIKPILIFLTLPITFMTLGVFYLIINGTAFALAAWLVPGFTVHSFGSAMLGALLVGAVSWCLGSFGRGLRMSS
jgi:putative membrane protein